MTATSPKVAILNAYHCRNLGDRAIVECQAAWCRRFLHATKVDVYSQAWQPNAEAFGVASKRALFAPPLDFGAVRRSLAGLFDVARWLAKLGTHTAEFRSNDIFVLCGGGYLYSSHAPLLSRTMASLCVQSLAALSTGKPVVPFPQSFGPIKPGIDEMVVSRFCRQMRVLTPRDQTSMDWLEERGFAPKSLLIPDIVLAMRLLLPEYYGASNDIRDGLGISAADYSFARRGSKEEFECYVEGLAETASAFHRNLGGIVRLFVQVSLPGSDDDQRIVTALADRLRAMRVPVETFGPERGLKGYLDAISRCKVFVGSRMHACIFSLTTATPTIGLAYQPKFHGLFNYLGLSDWVTDISFDPAWLQERIFLAVERQKSLSAAIEEKVISAATGIISAMTTVAQRAGALPVRNRLAPDH